MHGRPTCSTCHGRQYHAAAEACGDCGDVGRQARDWVRAKCPGSVSGSGGHNAAFTAACAVVGGFAMDEGQALSVMAEWNALCSPPWSEGELRHKVRQAMAKVGDRGYLIWGNGGGEWRTSNKEFPISNEGVFEAKARENSREFDPAALGRAAVAAGRVESEAWLARVSPVAVEEVTPEVFLSGAYAPGDRVLVFTVYESQAQYLYEVPGMEPPSATAGVWALSPKRQEKARRVEKLPVEGKCGVWFLNQPVDGKWRINAGAARRKGRKGTDEGPAYGRRHGDCVTRWPFMVLESDEEGVEKEWLQFLCDLPVAIVALYTSGGRSIHALVRVNARHKAEWDGLRDLVKPFLTQYGADKGVFSAVRLTRLPGCLRLGKEVDGGGGRKSYQRYNRPLRQRLLYFNPWADGRAISSLVERREIGKSENLEIGKSTN